MKIAQWLEMYRSNTLLGIYFITDSSTAGLTLFSYRLGDFKAVL